MVKTGRGVDSPGIYACCFQRREAKCFQVRRRRNRCRDFGMRLLSIMDLHGLSSSA